MKSIHYILDLTYSCILQKEYNHNYKHKIDNAHKYDNIRFSLFNKIKE